MWHSSWQCAKFAWQPQHPSDTSFFFLFLPNRSNLTWCTATWTFTQRVANTTWGRSVEIWTLQQVQAGKSRARPKYAKLQCLPYRTLNVIDPWLQFLQDGGENDCCPSWSLPSLQEKVRWLCGSPQGNLFTALHLWLCKYSSWERRLSPKNCTSSKTTRCCQELMWRCISPGVRTLTVSLLQVPPVLLHLESNTWSFEAMETGRGGICCCTEVYNVHEYLLG